MAASIPLADYLFARLRQLGVESIHGVPGDYNLSLLDHVEPAGLRWVGNCNELNAGYAADGYARIKGVGALITTFGVGELSAVNAIAGAYAELARVVHIVGTPPRATQESRALVHHTLLDGDYTHFARMAEHVTAAQANLRDPRTAAELVDATLRQCLVHNRPVYLQLPVDMVAVHVDSARLSTPIALPPSMSASSADAAIAAIVRRFAVARRPMILVDGESFALDIIDEINQLLVATHWPTWTSAWGKSAVDESLSNFHGVWKGRYSTAAEREYVESADLVLCFGPHLSNTNTYIFTTGPPPDRTIFFKPDSVHVCGDAGSDQAQIFRDLPAKLFLSHLLTRVGVQLPRPELFTPPPSLARLLLRSDDAITQDEFYRYLDRLTRPGDIILAETGTPAHGCRDMQLKQGCRLLTPATWLSIGYMLPAAQGAALAQRERQQQQMDTRSRTILLIGDGSFQMTAQELSTILRLRLPLIVILINNSGYTIERCLHGSTQAYNDVSAWRYSEAPAFFGASVSSSQLSSTTQQNPGSASPAPPAISRRAATWSELKDALDAVDAEESRAEAQHADQPLCFVEVMMEREDAPPALADLLAATKAEEARVERETGKA